MTAEIESADIGWVVPSCQLHCHRRAGLPGDLEASPDQHGRADRGSEPNRLEGGLRSGLPSEDQVTPLSFLLHSAHRLILGRYPTLYAAGTPFYSWANLYPRVVATAQNFVRGFLGETAASLGTVVTVNSVGSGDALFDSLGPSDMCPAYSDGNGLTYGMPQ